MNGGRCCLNSTAEAVLLLAFVFAKWTTRSSFDVRGVGRLAAENCVIPIFGFAAARVVYTEEE